MRTRVCITIDTEFSIAGAFTDPACTPVAEPMVWCEVAGRSQGLGFLLAQFARFGIRATFMVETAQRHYFRTDPMAAVVRRIGAEGHEVQLHTHPCWSVFARADWRERVRSEPRQDDFFGRAEEDTVALLRHGQHTFGEWGMPAPTVFRSGNLQHDDTLYRAMARCGIAYSSCVGMTVFDSRDPRYQLYSGMHRRHGVLEMPVLTFQDWRLPGKRHLKTLTIAGTSFEETRLLLERAHAAGVPLVVILTHPFEFAQRRDDSFRVARGNVLHQQRLVQLCSFLHDEPARFLPSGLGEAGNALAQQADGRNVLLEGSGWYSVRRLAQQAVNDCYGGYVLARREAAMAAAS